MCILKTLIKCLKTSISDHWPRHRDHPEAAGGAAGGRRDPARAHQPDPEQPGRPAGHPGQPGAHPVIPGQSGKFCDQACSLKFPLHDR